MPTNQTPKKTDVKTTKTTTVSTSTTADSEPAQAQPKLTMKLLNERLVELQQSISQRPGNPDLQTKVDQIDAILKSVSADEGNEYLTTLHERKLEGVERALNALGEEVARIDAIERNVTQIGGKQNRLVGRVRTLEVQYKPFKFPFWTLFVGIPLGIVAGLVWNWIDFKSPIPGLPNTEPQFYSDFRNDLYMAFVFGLIVFMATLSIGLIIAWIAQRSDAKQDQPQATTQDPDYVALEVAEPRVPQNPNPVTAEHSAGVAPTKSRPAAQGVHAGAQ